MNLLRWCVSCQIRSRKKRMARAEELRWHHLDMARIVNRPAREAEYHLTMAQAQKQVIDRLAQEIKELEASR